MYQQSLAGLKQHSRNRAAPEKGSKSVDMDQGVVKQQAWIG